MADEKTEAPTPKRLADARKKGQVAHSKDVVTAALTVTLFAYFWATWGTFVQRMTEILVFPPQFYEMPFSQAAKYSFDLVLQMVTTILVPVLGITVLVGIAANVAMVGGLLAFEAMKPSLDKINPAGGVKRIFSAKNLFELLKSTLKTAFLAVLLTTAILDGVGALIRAPVCGIPCLQDAFGQLMTTIAIYTMAAFVVLAAADYAFQRFQHIKGLKMSKEEVKREYKESEGDPHIKGRRKQLMHELVMSNDVGAVKNASVVVTNPTHLAVALRYVEGETPVPIVVAKGENLNAERILALAREAGVPIMRDVPLARSLYEQVAVDRYVPSDLLEPVAEVLRFVRELAERERR
jgi:type III secretion protein U